MAKLNFGGLEENVVTRDEFPLSKAQDILRNETVAVIGYGVQGPGQALNQKDNGINVIVGQRKDSKTWDKAIRDGFVPGKTLFEIEEALEKGTIICYLLSDAAQIALWPTVKKHLTPGKALYFSHGFEISFQRTNRYHSYERHRARGSRSPPAARAECADRNQDPAGTSRGYRATRPGRRGPPAAPSPARSRASSGSRGRRTWRSPARPCRAWPRGPARRRRALPGAACRRAPS